MTEAADSPGRQAREAAPGQPRGESQPPRKAAAHDHKQLAAVLGWTPVQVAKSAALGVLPPYDLKTPRWKASTVEALASRREELAAALDEGALLTEEEMRLQLGLDRGDWHRGREHGVIPGPDRAGFWTRAAAEALAARDGLREAIPPQPLGAHRCAELLAGLTSLDVTSDDIVTLAGLGHVDTVDYYKEWPLYDVAAVQRLGTTQDGAEAATAVVAERQTWHADSVTTEEAARSLGWDSRDLGRIAAQQGVKPGRFRRWARADIARLGGDQALADQVRRGRLLGPDQAAQLLEVRRTDFEYCVAAGWVTAAATAESRISRRRTVSVPLYRAGDVEDLRDVPGVDWEAVRSRRPGEPSVLREFARLPLSRAVLVHGLAADLAERHGTTVTARYDDARDRWDLAWTLNPEGQPAEDAVKAIIRNDRDLAPHARGISLHARRRDAPNTGDRQ